ncbi:MAG: glycosyltransferase [Sulfitobacter dubius]
MADVACENDRVKAFGRVPDGDLRGLYEGASGFVFAALHEGFGIPPLEAMRLGVPVICARSGAMPEVLGDAPLWFNPREERDIARTMKRFVGIDSNARIEMIRAGQRYCWRKSALMLAEGVVGVTRQLPSDREAVADGPFVPQRRPAGRLLSFQLVKPRHFKLGSAVDFRRLFSSP